MNSPTTILHSIQFMKHKLRNEQELLIDLKKDFNLISRHEHSIDDRMTLGDITKKIGNQPRRRVKTIGVDLNQGESAVGREEVYGIKSGVTQSHEIKSSQSHGIRSGATQSKSGATQSKSGATQSQQQKGRAMQVKKAHRKQLRQLQQAHQQERSILQLKHSEQLSMMEQQYRLKLVEQSEYIVLLEEQLKEQLNKHQHLSQIIVPSPSPNQNSTSSSAIKCQQERENQERSRSNQDQQSQDRQAENPKNIEDNYRSDHQLNPRSQQQYQFIVNQLLRDNQLLIQKLQLKNKEVAEWQHKHKSALHELDRLRRRINPNLSRDISINRGNTSMSRGDTSVNVSYIQNQVDSSQYQSSSQVSKSSRSQSRLKFIKNPASIPSINSRRSNISVLNDENIDTSNISRVLQSQVSIDYENESGIQEEEGKMKTIRGMVDGRVGRSVGNVNANGKGHPQSQLQSITSGLVPAPKRNVTQGYLSLKI